MRDRVDNPTAAAAATQRHQSGHQWLVAVAVLTVLAALLRGWLLVMTVDVPGDGPVKALMAYHWSGAPHVVLHGVWLPGFQYLTGLVSYVFPMWIGLRLLNALVGTVTVPVFFAAVAPVFGPATAIIAAAWMAVFPLHVELSASSLTDVTTLCEVLLGLVFLKMAADPHRPGRPAYTALALSSFVMASMTRYEVSLLLPFLPSYFWLRTRNWRAAAGIAAVLVVFPLAWTAGNSAYEGHPLLGFDAAIHDRSLANTSVPVSKAIEIMMKNLGAYLGRLVVVLSAVGLVLEVRSLVARRLSPERILHLAIALLSLASMGAFTALRGETLINRYLLFSFVFAIPIALVPVSPYLTHFGRWGLGLVIALALRYTVGAASLTGRIGTGWVTRVKPLGMIRFAEWMNNSAWRDKAVVVTRMDWQPTYIPYYYPSFACRIITVSEWTDDRSLKSTQTLRPALLVTQRGDEACVERFARVTGIAVENGRLVHRDSKVEVYELVTSQATH